MPKYGVSVTVYDEGGFVIEATNREEAEAALAAMERDEVENLCSFHKGDYSAELEDDELEEDTTADVKAGEILEDDDGC